MWRVTLRKPSILITISLALGLSACQTNAPLGRSSEFEGLPESQGFSAEFACAVARDLQALGNPSDGQDWIDASRRELRALLAATTGGVTEIRISAGPADDAEEGLATPPGDLHLVGLLPGRSSDLLLLFARYGDRAASAAGERATNRGASSVALVLELARTIGQQEEQDRPYTLMIVLLDATHSPPTHASAEQTGQDGLESSRKLALEFEERGLFQTIRLAAFFQDLEGTALNVRRDLYSDPIYRDVFFEAAADLGHADAFPADARFGSRVGSHRAFVERGLSRVVAISSDPARPIASGEANSKEQQATETCSRETLATVAAVTLEALDRIGRRLARIDRFPEAPLSGPPPSSSLKHDPQADAEGAGQDREASAAIASGSQAEEQERRPRIGAGSPSGETPASR